MKRTHLILTALLVALACRGAAPTVLERARTYMQTAQWPNANAMYTLEAEDNPRSPEARAGIITTAALQADTAAMVTALAAALDNRVAVDSLLGSVETMTRLAGRPLLYADILEYAAGHYPWLQRICYRKLLDYYTFNRNAPGIIRYATLMLEGDPDNTSCLALLARGYLLDGQGERAAALWRKILDLDPGNYPTLLLLGSWLQVTGRHEAARTMFERAQGLRPTPHVQALLAKYRTTE